MTRVYAFDLNVALKDEMPDGSAPDSFPPLSEMAAVLQDYLADMTKHTEDLTWRVNSVIPNLGLG